MDGKCGGAGKGKDKSCFFSFREACFLTDGNVIAVPVPMKCGGYVLTDIKFPVAFKVDKTLYFRNEKGTGSCAAGPAVPAVFLITAIHIVIGIINNITFLCHGYGGSSCIIQKRFHPIAVFRFISKAGEIFTQPEGGVGITLGFEAVMTGAQSINNPVFGIRCS